MLDQAIEQSYSRQAALLGGPATTESARSAQRSQRSKSISQESSMDVGQRLERMESIEQIRNLKALYCDLCDEGYDADALCDLFTENGVWDGGRLGRFEGRERMHRFFTNMPNVMSFAIHHVTNSAIVLSDDGQSAEARWYLIQMATQKIENR
ncbi:uncharacterized protein METZ01_LOCUS505414, partial [marine metagenome]